MRDLLSGGFSIQYGLRITSRLDTNTAQRRAAQADYRIRVNRLQHAWFWRQGQCFFLLTSPNYRHYHQT
jgi:hypothetical protein